MVMVWSKIKEVVVRGLSKTHPNERETVKSSEKCNEEKPKVVCEETEVQERSQQCSKFEEMDTQDYPDSPTLFPSQNSEDKEWVEDSGEDSDCYEIVDKPSTTGLRKEKSTKKQPVKDKSRLRLTRKRQSSQQADEDSPETSESKQRRLMNDESVVPDREKTECQDIQNVCLPRVYKRTICETIEEADRSNLFYAPQNVAPAAYTPVIARKLENYQRRLRHAQSKFRSSSIPKSHFAVVNPVSGKSRAPAGRRNKRTNVVKKHTLEYKKWAERNKNNYPFVAVLCDVFASLEPKPEAAGVVHMVKPFNKVETTTECETQTNNDDVVCTKVSPRRTSKTAQTPPRDKTTSRTTQRADVSNGVSRTTVKNDITTDNVNSDVSMKTENNGVENVGVETVKNDIAMKTEDQKVVMETVNNKPDSPVKQVLNEEHRKSILEEINSDDDNSQRFNFQRPELPEDTEQSDCVLIETIKSVTKEPSRQQVPESIECPMCYKKFPSNTIEQHAFHCNGPSDASTSSVRTVKVQDGQLSPVINTRTPTKVKELKLLINAETRARALGNKDERRNSTGEINMEGKKQTDKRISLEPCIKLENVVTTRRRWGESVTNGNKDDCNKKKEPTPPRKNINETLQKKRLSLSNTRKIVEKNSWPDCASLKKDFIPLEVEEKENEKISSKDMQKLLSLVDTLSSESSSDEEVKTKKPVSSKRKSTEVDDDMSALDVMATDYSGRKRKPTRNVHKKAKKAKVSSADEIATEHCYICGKDMPRSEFNEHVNEELARQAKEDKEKDLSMMSSMSQNTQSGELNVVEPTTSSDSRRPLPDLAEGTTWSTNDEEDAPRLKTYTPIRDGSAYHNQFSSQQEEGQSNQNRGQRSRGQRSRGQRGKGRWELRR